MAAVAGPVAWPKPVGIAGGDFASGDFSDLDFDVGAPAEGEPVVVPADERIDWSGDC